MGSVSTPRDAAAVVEMINANWMSQAIGAAARLGLPERLAARPMRSDELAERAACDPSALARLLLALESLGLTQRDAQGAYALTAGGACLLADDPNSVREWALWTAQGQWGLWPHLADSVRSGRSARALVAGSAGYAHFDDDSDLAAGFHVAMVELTRLMAPQVLAAFDFSTCSRIVDVGGGHGELLTRILQHHPHLRGTVADLPHAEAGARAHWAAEGVAERARFEAVDFFRLVPGGGDLYLLKSILHNWDDVRASAILRRCALACGEQGRIVVIERLLPEPGHAGNAARAVARADLNMLISFGGRERTEQEYAGLLAAQGFQASPARPVGGTFHLIEAFCVRPL